MDRISKGPPLPPVTDLTTYRRASPSPERTAPSKGPKGEDAGLAKLLKDLETYGNSLGKTGIAGRTVVGPEAREKVRAVLERSEPFKALRSEPQNDILEEITNDPHLKDRPYAAVLRESFFSNINPGQNLNPCDNAVLEFFGRCRLFVQNAVYTETNAEAFFIGLEMDVRGFARYRSS